MTENQGLLEKLADIPNTYVWAIWVIGMCVLVIYPVILPTRISPWTKDWVDALETVPENGRVVFVVGMSAEKLGAVKPITQAILTYFWTSDLNYRVYILPTNADHLILTDEIITEVMDPEGDFGKVYGEDYVLLNYHPSTVSGINSFCDDVWKVMNKDYFGTPFEELPMMDAMRSYEDIDMLVLGSGDCLAAEKQIVVWYGVYGVPNADYCLSCCFPNWIPYVGEGRPVQGLIDGNQGANELELYTKRPGVSAAFISARSWAVGLAMVLIVLGNIGDYAKRRKE